ncbi:MAG TPA: zf-HC2 domain-containing protein [Polyangiaceae bacterium]|jgi:anti-sigma factor RsiW|nr:zf-HC2 domain-containing protein [Polyangiaceae bacterium]
MTVCDGMRERMTELTRDALPPRERAELEAHVEQCAACAEALEREMLTADLLGRLPRRTAPADLKDRVRARVARRVAVAPWPRFSRRFIVGLAAAVAVSLAMAVALTRLGPKASEPMIVEAVNDHLRVLYAESPLEVAASDQHQVKPWFSGKVDFAPAIRFGGDDKFVLTGGAVALFVDRKAALFVFKRRLHEITLLNFRADSLPWPRTWNAHVGDRPALVTTRNGFHVILWQADGLGYALTSDLSEPELAELAGLLAGKPEAPPR